jgi:protein-S-isoprenylcysteine O-methyltransferase Ste14
MDKASQAKLRLKGCGMTTKTPPRFTLNSDFRMPLSWAVTLLLLAGVIFISVSNPATALSERMQMLYLTVSFYGLALAAWFFNEWFPLL